MRAVCSTHRTSAVRQSSLSCDRPRWVERIRECLEPALAAEVFQRDEQLGRPQDEFHPKGYSGSPLPLEERTSRMDTAIAKSLAAAEEATVQAPV